MKTIAPLGLVDKTTQPTAESSPSCSKTMRIAGASASLTTTFRGHRSLVGGAQYAALPLNAVSLSTAPPRPRRHRARIHPTAAVAVPRDNSPLMRPQPTSARKRRMVATLRAADRFHKPELLEAFRTAPAGCNNGHGYRERISDRCLRSARSAVPAWRRRVCP
jgi:hypothetical protein